MRTVTLHKKDIIIDKTRLKIILNNKELTYIDLYRKITGSFGLDLKYKGFMSLLDNKSSWKLLYAYAISDVLDIKITDIFTVIDVNIKEKKKEKNEWREKYQKK